ncbi:GmrSD restriction endonuclease domain-containing protein [Desulfotruncus alcoholivorax]|uniref:GmrSD restriction endonuclease domain-containing protein n=1 Tax=Desulfotruncus alcoholivorax TaxID=265477 RepID=UPI0004167838|nr:DUF262 domain-containing protein [Desulfotruncus alcoholivorax]
MKNQKETIRKMVGYLNNPEKDGGFWLPNIQRPFVWNEGQIERLFDSIMREYPISTLLVWKTKSNIRRRKFIDNYKHGLRLTDFYVPADNKTKMLVLDGQQRLQSLFIGLKGSYEKKELYFDILSGELVAPEDIRFRFKFIESEKAKLPWVKFKDLVFSRDEYDEISENVIASFDRELTIDEKKTIRKNVARIVRVFQTEENIVYQELDSVDKPNLYTEDDVVEIFIRANSGGTVLGKSDLLFSLLTVSWEDADEKMQELLDELNRTGYGFNRDFILKTCLTLLGKGAAYNVTKFRDEATRESIVANWDRIASAIKDIKDYLYGKTYIRSDKALPSYLVLIPVIYFRYHYEDKWRHAKGIDDYILRTLVSGAFSGNPDNLIDKCTREIDSKQDFMVNDIFGAIRADGRSLEIARETIFDQYYGSKNIHLIFNIWYKDFNYHPSFQNNSPQVDHIFPQSLLKSVKIKNPNTGRRDVLKYKWWDRDQIANLMLLTQQENGAGGKSDTSPEEWFKDKPEDYLDLHLIPKDKDLWRLENYESFIEERKKLIEKKFSYLIIREN